MNVAIIGLGLMGGSLGLALRERRLARVTGYARRAETAQAAVACGAVDACADTASAAVAEADVAVFCTPVLTIPDLVRECRNAFRPGCAVTDVGSTKAELDGSVQHALAGTGAIFVGSHPMAGSEKSGLEAARADLYEGAVTAVTPGVHATDDAVTRVCDLWSGVGSRVVRLEAAEHDALVARTSHLPHLVAALLVMAAARPPAAAGPFCGPGFRDTTRIAGGSPDMWHDIVKTNRAALLAELRAFGSDVERLTGLLEREDYDGIKGLLEEARTRRAGLLG